MAKWSGKDIPSRVGTVALVTGANSGIGWHTALELVRAGGEVVMTARTAAKGQDAVDRVKRQIPQAVGCGGGDDWCSVVGHHAGDRVTTGFCWRTSNCI